MSDPSTKPQSPGVSGATARRELEISMVKGAIRLTIRPRLSLLWSPDSGYLIDIKCGEVISDISAMINADPSLTTTAFTTPSKEAQSSVAWDKLMLPDTSASNPGRMSVFPFLIVSSQSRFLLTPFASLRSTV